MARRARSRTRTQAVVERWVSSSASLALMALACAAVAHGDLATAVAALTGSGLVGRR